MENILKILTCQRSLKTMLVKINAKENKMNNWNLLATVTVNNRKYILNLFDSAGQVNIWEKKRNKKKVSIILSQEEYDQLRIMAYPNTNIFILCFSVVDPDSYSNIMSKWIPELNRKFVFIFFLWKSLETEFRLCTTCTDRSRWNETRPT